MEQRNRREQLADPVGTYVGLLDNAQLEPLAKACIDEKRDEFMLAIAPLYVIGGTGSPANPIAVF